MGLSPKSLKHVGAQSRAGATTTDGHRENFDWLVDYLDLWARWQASGGAGGNTALSSYQGDIGAVSTAADKNGTAYDNLMLDIDAVIAKLPATLERPIYFYFRRDMGRDGTARACGISVRALDGRLSLAYYHIAEHLRSKQ